MAARGNMVLKDRQTTPVNHTFTPDGDDSNGVSVWSEKTLTPAGNPRVTASMSSGNGKYKTVLKLSVPVVATQTINGVSSPVVLRTSYAEIRTTVDAFSTEQERKDFIGLLADLLLGTNAQANDMLVNLTPVW